MLYMIIKIIITTLLVVGISEVSKRSSFLGGLLASLPLVSFLAMIWLYRDTGDSGKIIDLSWGIFWAVLPSQVFFVALPLLLKSGMKFAPAMILSCLIMFAAYTVYVAVLGRFGIKI